MSDWQQDIDNAWYNSLNNTRTMEPLKASEIAKEDPIMKQIADDALGYAKDLSFKPPKRHVDYAAGAIRQDQIAWNRCLDAVRILLMMSDKSFASAEDYKSIVNELEKLRR